MFAKELKKIILEKLHVLLKPEGFKKNGANFIRLTNDLSYYINIQSSEGSTASMLKVTLNMEICSLPIAKMDDDPLPIKHKRHWRQRIGFFLDKPFDKWWTIHTAYEAEEAVKEICDIMSNKILPEFDKLKTTSDLVDLWKKDKCPGLTEFQRRKYLQVSKGIININNEA
jgi:hypothetical protein